MKSRSLLLYFMAIMLCSCSENGLELSPLQDSKSEKRRVQCAISSGRDAVHFSDVMKILTRESKRTGSFKLSDCKILPYVSECGDSSLFIVNIAGHGWRIYSSDRRTPSLVAEGDEGQFSLEDGSPSCRFWIKRMANQISLIKTFSDDLLSFSPEEIRMNRSFWSGDPVSIDGIRDPVIPTGHWEEVIINEGTVVCDSIHHLTPKWHQWKPYNRYCPKYPGSDDRAWAGCVAVAGSQMLYYLHNLTGCPAVSFSNGYCEGDVNNFSRCFTNATSSSWDMMSHEHNDSLNADIPEAVLIASVGARVNMHYCGTSQDNGYSWAIPTNLKDDLFLGEGISCVRSSYDENRVIDNISSRRPVIVWASDLAIPVDGDIHCFIIDGYQISKREYTHLHYFVADNPSIPIGFQTEYYTFSYSSPVFSGIKINWGWRSQWSLHVNDGWYSTVEGWTVVNGGTYDYNHNVYMLYDFEVSNN